MAYRGDEGSLVRFLGRMGLLGSRLTIAHGVWITDDEITSFGAAAAALAPSPISNLKLLNGVAPIRTCDRAGAGLAIGYDNCSGNDAQNIFEAMKSFALYWGLQGEGERRAPLRGHSGRRPQEAHAPWACRTRSGRSERAGGRMTGYFERAIPRYNCPAYGQSRNVVRWLSPEHICCRPFRLAVAR
jgi:Amidohydrolase family